MPLYLSEKKKIIANNNTHFIMLYYYITLCKDADYFNFKMTKIIVCCF